jgi:NIMA-interacting peptidyl-prolyl cis-trans isomerase 4
MLQCEKFSKKEEALEKLRNGGKFDDVAREYSEDKARQGMFPHTHVYIFMLTRCAGGSLGWKVRGSLDSIFEKAAYDLEPSTTNNPKYVDVKTSFGYHIIMVEGRK